MSSLLIPSDFGLPDLELSSFKTPKLCRVCWDEYTETRWGGYYHCPDCDIKRMARCNTGIKQIEKRLKGETP